MILHHVFEGVGPPLLLLHSWTTDARQWQRQVRDLRSDHMIVAPDFRGYGRSPLTPAPFSHADDVVRLLDHRGIERCAVVASSGGGAVALQVASAVSDRVSALVLLCAAAEGVGPTDYLRAFNQRACAAAGRRSIRGNGTQRHHLAAARG